eukprot:3298148-Rhodomonas_salina.1
MSRLWSCTCTDASVDTLLLRCVQSTMPHSPSLCQRAVLRFHVQTMSRQIMMGQHWHFRVRSRHWQRRHARGRPS